MMPLLNFSLIFLSNSNNACGKTTQKTLQFIATITTASHS